MSSFPVVIRCGDVSVAVPISKLIQESTVFKAMYENQELGQGRHEVLDPPVSNPDAVKPTKTNSNANDGQQEEGKNDDNSNEAVLDNSNDESEDSGLKSEEDETMAQEVETMAQESNTNTVDNLEDVAANPNITKHNTLEGAKKSPKNLREQADIFEIRGYMGESVKALFGYLAGFTELLTGCTSIQILADILKICGTYDILCPLPLISERVDACAIDMENLVNTTEAALEIQKILALDICKNISNTLLERCISYARDNFGSWLEISHFLQKNKDKTDLVNKILGHLKNDKIAFARFTVFEEFTTTAPCKSKKFILNNLEWNLIFFKTEEGGISYLSCELECSNPNGSQDWFCEAHVELKLLNQKNSNHVMGFFDKKFGVGNRRHGFLRFKAWSEVIDPDQGFIKAGSMILEVKIVVKDVAGIKDSKGIQEKDIQLWDKFLFVTNDGNKKATAEAAASHQGLRNDPVMLTCESMNMVVLQSVLTKESMYFRAFFNEDWTSSEEVPQTLFTEKQAKTPFARTRQIKIEGYNQKAVRILFDFLQGFDAEMEKCTNFTLLADMMSISDFYIITRSLPIIISRINMIEIRMDNLIEAYATAQKLNVMESNKGLGEYLASRCVAYARANLSSWQVLINFVVQNYSKMNLVKDLNQILTMDKTAVFRYKVDNYGSMNGEVNTPSYAFHNMQFVMNIKKSKDFLSAFLVWGKPDISVTKAKAKYELKLYNYLDGSYYTKAGQLEMLKDEEGRAGFSEFMACTESDPQADNAYIKDDAIFLEAKIEIVEFVPTI